MSKKLTKLLKKSPSEGKMMPRTRAASPWRRTWLWKAKHPDLASQVSSRTSGSRITGQQLNLWTSHHRSAVEPPDSAPLVISLSLSLLCTLSQMFSKSVQSSSSGLTHLPIKIHTLIFIIWQNQGESGWVNDVIIPTSDLLGQVRNCVAVCKNYNEVVSPSMATNTAMTNKLQRRLQLWQPNCVDLYSYGNKIVLTSAAMATRPMLPSTAIHL